MFKPLLRTLPTLSGNFTIACKLREFDKESTNEYSTYVRLANLIPLQNFLAKKDIELNLLNGKYEYDLLNYYKYYTNTFYKPNFVYNRNNYAILDLDSIYNYNNDTRNKDYEFGCKRIQYSQHGSQFNFYAPIYIDNADDLPEYFCINLEFNNHLTKKIKIYINKNNKRNYLKTYLQRYLKQIDERVIFCLPESLQATYFGVDVKNGGIVQYKDNTIGNIYINQTTINNFDYTICQGFERNTLIMRQIIPLSFSFNVNDLFNNYEKDFFEGIKIKIYGHYYTKGDLLYDMYDFDINYINSYNRFNKYNSYSGKYEYSIGENSEKKKINIMDVGFPALNESKYVKYEYTNKITPMYCKFKMMLSDDNYPYITNINFAYSYNQYPNQKYGEFPTMFKGIYPKAIIEDSDFKLPIAQSLDNYYKTSNIGVIKSKNNTNNIEKYIKLMSNYYSSWYNINEYSPDFTNDNYIKSLFDDDTLWSNVKYNYTYNKGILYSLNKLEKYNIDKFGIFCGVNLNYLSSSQLNDSIKASIVLSANIDKSNNKIFNYNESYNMVLYSNEYNFTYYNKILDINTNNLNTANIDLNCNMIKDFNGKYIEEKKYNEENTFYKFKDLYNVLSQLYVNYSIIEIIEQTTNIGFELLNGYNNINYFIEKQNTDGSLYKELIFKDLYSDENYNWIYNSLYYTNQLSLKKHKLSESYNTLSSDEDLNGKFSMFLQDKFIHKTDIINIILDYSNDNKTLLNNIFSRLYGKEYYYHIVGNENGIDIENYFILGTSDEYNIYVDTYNLNNYIKQYNKKYKTKINSISNNEKIEKFAKILDKNHLVEYLNELNKNENNFANYKCIFDLLYVKERCWIVSENQLQVKDRYLTLYNFLKNKIVELYSKYKDNNNRSQLEEFVKIIIGLYHNNDLSLILTWLTENISDNRTNNNCFTIKIGNEYIELDLCFKKEFILLDNNLKKMIKDNTFLYLYVTNKSINENLSIWKLITLKDVNKTKDVISYKDIDDYIIPLFNNIYFNNADLNNIKQMIFTSKINNNNKYVIDNGKCFKEIDVDKIIKLKLINDLNFINNFINYIGSLKILSINELVIFADLWNEYCIKNNIYLVNNSESYEIFVNGAIDFLKSYYDNIYRHIIRNKGIILYSKYNILNIKYDTIKLTDNLIYDNENNIYIYKYNNLTYAFYWISIDIDNTNNSFNIMNDYNLNIKFDYINGIEINSSVFKGYLKKIFYLIEPFLKINIFNEFSKNIKTIIYPNEMELNIKYMCKILNSSNNIKYKELLNDDSILYEDIIELSKSKKIKLLRYFNYITPYIKKVSVIKDLWELKFMDKSNITKNVNKHNVLYKDNINIYKYNGIRYYDGIYSNVFEDFVESTSSNVISNYSILHQYEYKHFNDNLIFNLPESIVIEDDKIYNYKELEKFKNNETLIKDKKIDILYKYFKDKNLDYHNIILFLFNKYDSNMIIEPTKLNSSKNEKLYKVSYTFKLI